MKLYFPIRFKFLTAMVCILTSALTVFFYVSYQTISEDKKMSILDLNMSMLNGAQIEIQSQLKQRLDEIQFLASRIYNPTRWGVDKEQEDPFFGLSESIRNELLNVVYWRQDENEKSFKIVKKFVNKNLLRDRNYPEDFIAKVQKQHPIEFGKELTEQGIVFLNRSLTIGRRSVPVLTILTSGGMIGKKRSNLVVSVDLLQDFLVRNLRKSEIAELFLIHKNGKIISHSNTMIMARFSGKPFPHPIITRLQSRVLPRESFELEVAGEPFIVNVNETALPQIYLVSQIKRSEAFVALKALFTKTGYLALFILCATVIIGIIFSRSLTANIAKLGLAAERIGSGELNISMDIRSRDEVQRLAETFKWMSQQIMKLLVETATKARMESELKTAHLIQSTLLKTGNVETKEVDIASHYVSATECGGDFWDVAVQGNVLTVVIGDATGHGAPAALVTAVVKSCISTLNEVYREEALAPTEFLKMLNRIVCETCKGQLLMTMCLVQINLETGDCTVSNAGHESPFCLRKNQVTSASRKSDKSRKRRIKPEVFFARGERLGFRMDTTYESSQYKLELDDVLLLYTDGVSEAKGAEGKEWGERRLQKAFAGSGVRKVNEMKSDILEALDSHTGGLQQEDDVTFVIVKWVEKNFGKRDGAQPEPAQVEKAPDFVEGPKAA